MSEGCTRLQPLIFRRPERPAELGRRRAGGTRYFPAHTALFAPAWLLERGLCCWIAVFNRATRGGVAYREGMLEKAATPVKELRRRLA